MSKLDIRIDWSAFTAGDERILERIYNTFFDVLYNFGRKYTTDEELVQDAIQDLFVRFWKNRANLREPPSLKNYLFKAFRNHMVDRLKAESRYVADELGDSHVFELVPSVEEVHVSDEVVHARKTKLNEAIERLTSRQREAVFLRFYEEFSYDEIANVLNITTKATYKLMARSIDAIREGLGKDTTYLFFILINNMLCNKTINDDNK